MVATGKTALATAIRELLQAHPPRAGSLAITVFGDTVSQQGNSVWLGSLVDVMEEFGLNARQIRTAVFRLGQEGWVLSTQSGRKSYYRYTEFGRRQYERAAERIYAAGTRDWDGTWTLVTPAGLEAPQREELRKQLGWQGFGLLTSGVLAHPRANRAALEETLAALGFERDVVVWQAARADGGPGTTLAGRVHECWQLDDLAARFAAFNDDFSPLLDMVSHARTLSARDAFVLRTLLIHEYRRILLKTTDLPEDLLPPGWPGQDARRIAAEIYRRVHIDAVAYTPTAMRNAEGRLPAPAAGYFKRFGGLGPLSTTASAA